MAASRPSVYFCLYITVNPSNILILTDFLNRIFLGEIAKIGGFCGGKIHTPASFYHTGIYHVSALRKAAAGILRFFWRRRVFELGHRAFEEGRNLASALFAGTALAGEGGSGATREVHYIFNRMAKVCDLILVHYSAMPLGEIKPAGQPNVLSPYAKPKGLWVSVESDQDRWNGWREWCEREQSALGKFEHAAHIHLRDDAKIKLVSGPSGIDPFTEQFSSPQDGSHCIDWKSVAKSYSGIVISPYLWEPRPRKPSWYYAWHCASGCIWDANAIRFAEALSSFKRPARNSREAA
jgi:hypothetical protein